MSLLDPASISLEENETIEQLVDANDLPVVGESVVIGGSVAEDYAVSSTMQRDPEQNRIQSGKEIDLGIIQSAIKLHGGQPLPAIPKILPDQITDEMHADFISLIKGGEVIALDEQHRQILEYIVQGNEYELVENIDDEFLGRMCYAVVHRPSGRILLNSEQREQVLEAAVLRYRDNRLPVGLCLQLIQKNYVGFPSVIKLRAAIMESLSRAKAGFLVQESEEVGDSIIGSQGGSNIHAINARAYHRTDPYPRSMSAIPDKEYDSLAQILSKKQKIEEIEDVIMREAIKSRLKSGLLMSEFWNEPNEFLSGGWRIRMRDSGKIVPRASEVDEIWRHCYEAMPNCTQKQLSSFLEERFVGIGLRSRNRRTNKNMLLKGTDVIFPNRPHCIGSKPMQCIQVDILAMDRAEHGGRLYNVMLIVTDLYSHFVYGGAIHESSDSTALIDHLINIFSICGPPEAYRSYGNDEVFEEVMAEIGKLFRIEIKNVGAYEMDYSRLCAEIYKHAELDFGSRNQWVDALPLALMEFNHAPITGLGSAKISPFEIMYGRRAWRFDSVPPWLQKDDIAEALASSLLEQGQNRMSKSMEMRLLKGLIPSRKAGMTERPAIAFLGDISRNRAKLSCMLGRYPVKYDNEGEIIDPGTGFIFEVGDYVYLRVIEQEVESSGRTKRGQVETRYYRATILEVDHQNADYMYKVCYWNDVYDVDSLSPDQWPDENASIIAWVSPYDIAPSTAELTRARNVVKRLEHERQCKCGYDFCGQLCDVGCPYKLSEHCCQRLKINCTFHSTKDNANVGNSVMRLAGGNSKKIIYGRKTTKSGSDQSKSRWYYHGGRFIELFAVPSSSKLGDNRDNVFYDYDVDAVSAKKKRYQNSYESAMESVTNDTHETVYEFDRPSAYETVELYETKPDGSYVLAPGADDLGSLVIESETADATTAKQDSANGPEPALNIGELKMEKEEQQGERRYRKRISAPPLRLSPI